MSDQQARQTPIIDLLRDIPADARMVYEVTSTHHQSIPVGVLAKNAADEIERLTAERERLRELECAVSNALPGSYYMDPPDGGDVPLGEQVRRMALDARRYRWLRENLGKWRIETYQTPEQSMVELHILGDSFFYNGDDLDRIIDGQRRDAAMGREG